MLLFNHIAAGLYELKFNEDHYKILLSDYTHNLKK